MLDAGEWLWWLAAIVVGVGGAARFTRLIVHDEWPPTKAIREWWITKTSRVWDNGTVVDGPWTKLATCHWCFGPWAMAAVMLSAYFTNFHPAWWLFWGWLAAAYLTSWLVEHDEQD
jgi:hypothetical protein